MPRVIFLKPVGIIKTHTRNVVQFRVALVELAGSSAPTYARIAHLARPSTESNSTAWKVVSLQVDSEQYPLRLNRRPLRLRSLIKAINPL